MNESLLNTRKFSGIFSIQFLNAVNDNLLKNAALVMIAYHGLSILHFSSSASVNIVAIAFILPFFVFASYSGKIADSHDKVTLIRIIKICELMITLIATIGILYKNIWLILLAILAMSTHSTFFAPIKYSILPQYFSNRRKLLLANSLIEGGTFVAVLLGQILGSWFIGNSQVEIAVTVLILSNIIGLILSFKLDKLPPVSKKIQLHWNIIKDNLELYRNVVTNKNLKNVIHTIGWFWAIGLIYTTQLATFTSEYLGGNAQVFSVFLAEFSISIGIGCLACTYISNGKVYKQFVLIGITAMSLSTLLLLLTHTKPVTHLENIHEFISSWHGVICHFLIILLGFSAGFYSITCYNELQILSPLNIFSQVVAVNNIINALYMIVSTIICTILLAFISLWWLLAILVIGNCIFTITYWKNNF